MPVLEKNARIAKVQQNHAIVVMQNHAVSWSSNKAAKVAAVGLDPVVSFVTVDGILVNPPWSGGSSFIHDGCSQSSEWAFRRDRYINNDPEGVTECATLLGL